MAEQLPGAQTQRYGAVRQRTRNEGILVMPVAGPPGTPPMIVRVHAGLDMSTVDFDASKIGEPPIVPAAEPRDPNLILLGGSQTASLPMIQPGGHIWQLSGHYEYVHKKLTGLDGPMPTGMMPIDFGTSIGNEIPAEVFTTGIIAIPATTTIGKEALNPPPTTIDDLDKEAV